MPDDAEPPLSVDNSVAADVSGQIVLAGVVRGGVHLHQHAAVRPAARLPLRVELVPQRAASFQERATAVAELEQVLADRTRVHEPHDSRTHNTRRRLDRWRKSLG